MCTAGDRGRTLGAGLHLASGSDRRSPTLSLAELDAADSTSTTAKRVIFYVHEIVLHQERHQSINLVNLFSVRSSKVTTLLINSICQIFEKS